MGLQEVRLRIATSTEGFRADRGTLEQLAGLLVGSGLELAGPAGRVHVVGVRVAPTPSSDRALILEVEPLP